MKRSRHSALMRAAIFAYCVAVSLLEGELPHMPSPLRCDVATRILVPHGCPPSEHHLW